MHHYFLGQRFISLRVLLHVLFAMCVLLCLMQRGYASSALSSADIGKISDEEKGIKQAIHLYLNGTSFNNQSEINKAFYVNARLYLTGKDDAMRETGAQAYAKLFQ